MAVMAVKGFNVNWSTFLTLLEQWHPWRALIRQCRPGFASNGYVAHWCAIGHCVGVMAAHGVFQGRVVPPSTSPTPPHPTLPCPATQPTHPLFYQY